MIKKSSCILLYKDPLTKTAAKRLNIIRNTEDGFEIAEEDWRLRGEGELLGTKQSGVPEFHIANLAVHSDLLSIARKDARLFYNAILIFLLSKDKLYGCFFIFSDTTTLHASYEQDNSRKNV